MDLNIKNRGDYKMECISCNDKINIDVDDYQYTRDDEIICEGCYESDLDYPITIINNKNEKSYIGDYTIFNDFIEGNHDFLDDYAETINYIKTDGWRGYNKGKAPSGYISVESRWFCGFDGHNMNDFMFKFHQIIENCSDILECFDYFYAILPTSNVFSQNFELYIRKNQKEEFLKTINEEF